MLGRILSNYYVVLCFNILKWSLLLPWFFISLMSIVPEVGTSLTGWLVQLPACLAALILLGIVMGYICKSIIGSLLVANHLRKTIKASRGMVFSMQTGATEPLFHIDNGSGKSACGIDTKSECVGLTMWNAHLPVCTECTGLLKEMELDGMKQFIKFKERVR